MASPEPLTGRQAPRLAALALALLLVWLLATFAGGALQVAERAVGDLSWRIGAAVAGERAERRIVVVDIDERSLAQVGPWPWPRATIERLSRRLAEAGVATQVYDMVFSEEKEGDAGLAASWAAAPVVVGQIFSLNPEVSPAVGEVGGALGSRMCPPFAPASRGHIANAPGLTRAASAVGHMTPRVEPDGVIRSLPPLICHEGRTYPTLALAALWQVAQPSGAGRSAAAPDWLWVDRSPGLNPLRPRYSLSSASLPGVEVPLGPDGDVRIPYRTRRGDFVSVSAADVVSGQADRKLLRGAVAVVGATAFGLSDAVSTPLASVASGVEVHAQLMVGLLDGRIPYAPAAAAGLQWLAAVLVLAVLWLVSQHGGSGPAIKRLPLAGAGLAVLVAAGAAAALLWLDLWLPWAVPAAAALVGAAMLATAEHGLTQAQRERLSAHLGAYLPAPVARRLARSDPSGAVQVERREVSALVADIRNFSAFAAHRPPEETAALLHAFCSIAVDVVEAHGGVVENVVGDSVLAVWNAYSDCPDHAGKALAAAQELVRATRGLLEPKRPVHDADPVPPLALGVGIEAGLAVVGSFGPQRRRAHAALGEPVSVAIRLQKMTQELSFPILVGPHLAQLLPAQSTELVGEYLLEGLARHYGVHAPVGWAGLVDAELGWQPATAGRREAADLWSSTAYDVGAAAANAQAATQSLR